MKFKLILLIFLTNLFFIQDTLAVHDKKAKKIESSDDNVCGCWKFFHVLLSTAQKEQDRLRDRTNESYVDRVSSNTLAMLCEWTNHGKSDDHEKRQ